MESLVAAWETFSKQVNDFPSHNIPYLEGVGVTINIFAFLVALNNVGLRPGGCAAWRENGPLHQNACVAFRGSERKRGPAPLPSRI
jgi:hypothetical protein